LLPVLALSVFIPATSQSLLIPALPALARRHGASPDEVAWVLTAFLVVASAAAPLGGRLGELRGRRRMLLASLAAYVIGSLVCALAGSLALMVAGRALQGCVGGTFAIAVALLRERSDPARARRSIATLSVVVGAGTGGGFAIGGALAEHAPLALAFWGGAAVGMAALALAALVVAREPRPPREPFDLLGAALLVAGTALPLVAISQANGWGWLAPPTLLLAVAGALVLAAWARVERRRAAGAPGTTDVRRRDRARPGAHEATTGRRRARPRPGALVDLSALRARPVACCNVATLLLGCGMFGLFVLTPQLAQQPDIGLGMGATGAGLVLLPGSFAMLLVGSLGSRLGRRFGDHVALATGAATTALGLALLATARGGGTAAVVAWALLAAVGLGIAMPAMPALVAGAVPADRVGDAVGFNALLRGAGSAVGAQLSAAVLAATVAAPAALGAAAPTAAGSAPVATAAPAALGYTAAYALAAAAALAAALAALAAHPRRRPRSPQRQRPIGGARPLSSRCRSAAAE
jgi:MFS family permease